MANTYTQIYLHIIFSTKNRVDWIRPEIETRVSHRPSLRDEEKCDNRARVQRPVT